MLTKFVIIEVTKIARVFILTVQIDGIVHFELKTVIFD